MKFFPIVWRLADRSISLRYLLQHFILAFVPNNPMLGMSERVALFVKGAIRDMEFPPRVWVVGFFNSGSYLNGIWNLRHMREDKR
jgi:hypothetical protein